MAHRILMTGFHVNARSLAALALTLLPMLAFAQQQTLVVDDAHSQIGVPKDQKAPTYALKAGPRLLVDASKYTFKAPGGPANSLQLILGPDAQYSVAWDPAHPSVVVSSLTAHPNGTSKPFESFAAGQKVVVAIGNIKGTNFNVMWVGLADVK